MKRSILLSPFAFLIYYFLSDVTVTASIRGIAAGVPDERNLQVMTGALTGFNLVNALTEATVSSLTNNQVIFLSSIPGMTVPKFNIDVQYTGIDIKSVVFGLVNSATNNSNYKIEQNPPWAFCGNGGQDFYSCPEFGYGTHTVTATPKSGPNGTGISGTPISVTFTISAAAPTAPSPTAPAPKTPVHIAPVSIAPVSIAPVSIAPAPTAPVPTAPMPATLVLTGFNLINALNEIIITTLTNNQEIVVSSIPGMTTPSFNIDATSIGTDIKSVVFGLVNSATNNPAVGVENNPPWAFCGNGGLNFYTCAALGYGTHTVTATPKSGTGISGTPISITFTISAGAPIAPTPTAPAPMALVPTASVPIAPIPAAPVPTGPTTCAVPKFEGASFASATAYPFKLAEAQGMIVGDKYVIYGGFKDAWITPTAATHTLDLTNPAATWQRDDDIPQPTGLTHGAHIHVGNKLYNCGGYVGPHPGVHTTQCIVYDSSMPPGARWTTMTPMPVGHGKGGGGMFYNTALNAMYYISGAQRFISASGSLTTRDLNSTFMYSFNNPTDGWVRKADLPYGDYGANHMMAVTARDGTGAERHYGFGGQRREEEPNGNYDHVFEYNAQTDVWTRRAKMLWPLAHASSSTIPFGCGFIVVAGNTNGAKITSNITFYNTETDSWTQIGNLPTTTNTPVCDIHRPTSTLFCETGKLWTTQSYKRRIVIP